MKRAAMPQRAAPLRRAPLRSAVSSGERRPAGRGLPRGQAAPKKHKQTPQQQRRAELETTYRRLKGPWLRDRLVCERCGGRSVCVHHRAGREGLRLIEQRWWAASCLACNDFAETDTGAALDERWLLSYINPEGSAA